MSTLRSLVLVLMVLLPAAAHTKDRPKSEHLTAEDRQLFAWFDQLGFEDFTHAGLVRICFGGEWFIGDSKKGLYDEPRAFLLWQKGAKCRVLLNDLTAATLVRHGTNPRRQSYVRWHPVSLEAETAALLTLLRQNPSPASWTDGHDVDADQIDLPTQAFVLARYCAARGREDLAARLIHVGGHDSAPEKAAAHSRAIQLELSSALERRATLAFANPNLSRHAMAALFQHIADMIPQELQIGNPGALAETLRKMAAEDDTHPRLSARQFAALSETDQAQELVFQLRNEFDPTAAYPRRPWPFAPPRSNGAREKLAALGHTAVPALLEALHDSRRSREVVGGVGSFSNIFRAREIRELASDALDDIAGVRLWDCVDRAGESGGEAMWSALEAVAADWWMTTQEKGDAAWLRARVESGGPGAAECLDALTKRHPTESVALALASIPGVTDPVRRGEMLARLSGVHTPQADALLLEELAHGPTFANHVAAAYLLNERHRPEGMAAMMSAAASLPDHIQCELQSFDEALPNPDMFRVPLHPDSTALVLAFLLYSDSPPAIRVIQTVLPRCEIDSRARILAQCAVREETAAAYRYAPAGPATRRAIEELLISELADNTDLQGMVFNDQALPTFAHYAAAELARCWPAKYRYSLHAPPQVRAAQLAALRARAVPRSATPVPASPTNQDP